ncbi:TetR family transcriptional regulator [Streptomyces sp. NPDC026672]|uniref:TetR/AcrR family transcriptional regulator n=1 Tax=unclassified Streptomyces TaxID=2593676 RepID=UPI0033EB98E4
MTNDAPAVPQRRARDSEATRRAILTSAIDAFSQSGYDGASTRDIAREAGVDPRLITRYYGSKEALFEQVVEEVYRHPLMMIPGENREVAKALLSDSSESAKGLLLTIRSSGNERAVEIMREHLEHHYQRELAGALPGHDPVVRAALLIAICSGVQMQRNVLRNSALQDSASDEAIVERLAAALDLVGSEDLG